MSNSIMFFVSINNLIKKKARHENWGKMLLIDSFVAIRLFHKKINLTTLPEIVTNNCDLWHVLPQLSVTQFWKLLSEQSNHFHQNFLTGDGFDGLFPAAHNYVLILTDLMSSAAENVYKTGLPVFLAPSILFGIHLLRYKEAWHHFEYQIYIFF